MKGFGLREGREGRGSVERRLEGGREWQEREAGLERCAGKKAK